MRSLFIEGKTWFDKVNGNSYFSCRIHIDGKLAMVLPFQYGYGNQFEYEAMRALADNGKLPEGYSADSYAFRLREAGVDVYTSISEGKKADVVRFGKSEVFA